MKTQHALAAIVTGLAVCLALHAVAQTPYFPWAKRVASTTDQDDELSIGLALDGATNLHVTGWFDGTNDFGGVLLTNSTGGGQDIFVAKYSPAGSLLWARRAGGNTPDRDGGRGIGVDNTGNVYAAGEFVGDADFDGWNLTGSTAERFFLAKYDSGGEIEWVRQSVGQRSVYGTGLAVDGAGNSHAVGYIDNLATATFDGNTSLTNTNRDGYCAFLVKYDNAGNVQWAKLLESPVRAYATKVAVAPTGDICVRGSFNERLIIGRSNLVAATSEGNMFVAKFDSAGDLIWAQQSRGADVDEGGVAVDQAFNVYVTGWYFGGSVDFGGMILTNAGSGDAFVAKYNASGEIQWARRAGGPGLDFYWDAALDATGNLYVGGVLSPKADALSESGATAAKYDPSGTLQWTCSASGPAADPVASIVAKCAVGLAGNGYVAGWYQTPTTFGETVLPPRGYWNFFLAEVGFRPFRVGIARSDGLARMSVSGKTGDRVALEYHSSLVDTNPWSSLVTTTLTSDTLILEDAGAAGSPTRFYRVRLVP